MSGDVVTSVKLNKIEDAIEELSNTGGEAEGSNWILLHDSTTSAEGLLQVAVTNIACREFMIYLESYPTENVHIYISPNQSNGSHYDAGYGRTFIGTGTTTGNAKYAWCHINHQVGNMVMCEQSGSFFYGNSEENEKTHMAIATQPMNWADDYTSISIGTYQNVSANTRVIILGKTSHDLIVTDYSSALTALNGGN